jgi:hypothetical protein
MTYFLNLPKGSYQQELDNYFDQLKPNNLLTRSVSKSALCQARQQLSPTDLINLNHRVM